MNEAKKQSQQHVIDRQGEALLLSKLPPHWILRPYRPDYGLDFTLELFGEGRTGGGTTYETLGEHFFIQLKSTETSNVKPLDIYGRGNVEKALESLDKNDLVTTLDTFRQQIDVPELVTVERMGVGVPVLLVIADLPAQDCYFVCLNDYIDKILIPRHTNYRDAGHRTIHVPTVNGVATEWGKIALRWYGKRPKLMAAFQRFTFQFAELGWATSREEQLKLASYFAQKIGSYDFWRDTEMWGLVEYYGARVDSFLKTGDPNLNMVKFGDAPSPFQTEEDRIYSQVMDLWRYLSVLPRNYEDVCREWFLPTALGVLSSYPSIPGVHPTT